MTVFLFILGVLFMAVGIAASIALHEVGHLVPAKLFKVRVTQYMVGFGKTLWSTKKGETEYGFKLIPLGGYIAMIGMYPPNPETGEVRSSSTGVFQSLAEGVQERHEEAIRREPSAWSEQQAAAQTGSVEQLERKPERPQGRLAQLSAQARDVAHQDIQPGDENRMFYKLPVWKKLVIMLGGPTMNLLLGTILTAIVLMGFGIAQSTTTLAAVSACQQKQGEAVPQSTENCTPTPAAAAGLKPGDTITSYDGRAVSDPNELSSWIRDSAGRQVPVVVQRDGQNLEMTITPVLTARPVYNELNKPEVDAEGNAKTENVGFVGVSFSNQIVPQPITAVPVMVGDQLSRVVGVIVNLPQRVAGVAEAAFSSAPRDPNGPVSIVGVGRVAGEISAIEEASFGARFSTLLLLLAGLNFALGLFNLIPLYPLDGGWVAGALYEGLRRRLAKLFGRKDPGPVDVAKLLPVFYVVTIAMVLMGALMIYADIVKPITIR